MRLHPTHSPPPPHAYAPGCVVGILSLDGWIVLVAIDLVLIEMASPSRFSVPWNSTPEWAVRVRSESLQHYLHLDFEGH